MLHSHTRRTSDHSSHLSTIPNDIFLLNPSYAGRIIERSQLWSMCKKEIAAFSFLVFFCALLFVIAINSIKPLLDIRYIEQFGILTEARILETYAVVAGDKKQSMYQVVYQFTDPAGTIYNDNQVISSKSFDHFHTGDSVPIRYISDNPTLSTLADWAQDDTTKMSNVGVGLTSLASFLSILAATWFLAAYLWREEQFLGRGQVIMGHILTCQIRSANQMEAITSNRPGWMTAQTRVITLSYSFNSPDGRVIKSSIYRPQTELGKCALPKFGDPVAVLYLNNRRYRVL